MNAAHAEASTGGDGGVRIVFIGNSITLHGPLSKIGWTNNWGMAASAAERDYVHLVTRGIEKRTGRAASVKVRNLAAFERNYRSYDIERSLADLVAFDADYLVVALGENVPSLDAIEDEAGYREAFRALLKAFLSGKRRPRTVVRGVFWPNVAKDRVMSAVAGEFDVPFVRTDFSDDPSMRAVGLFEHKGITNHPNDKGMAETAGRILSALLDDKVEFGEWAWKGAEIRFVSSLDGTRQPAYLCRDGAGDEPVPLFVVLHSWSFGYTMLDPATWGRQEAFRRGWAFLYPHFRGPNNTPDGCGSDLAVQDIVDAVEYAKAHLKIDAQRIYLLGGSGGGHMALLMAGRHPEIWAGVYAACPITNVARWYRESKDPGRNLWPHYGDMIARCCGGTPDERADEYARRSPLTYLPAARSVPIDIITGVHDGHRLSKGGGSVPCGHAIRAFNCLAREGDRLSDRQIGEIERTQCVPANLAFSGTSPFFGRENAILLRIPSGNVRLTLFDAGHAGNYREGAEWLSHQRKGMPAVWNYGNMSAPCSDGAKEIAR